MNNRELITLPRITAASGLIVLLMLVCIALFSVYRLSPPVPKQLEPSTTEFSIERAMKDIRQIAQSPHPIGSAEHAKVREYLVKELRSIGLDPEVQEATVIRKVRQGQLRAGTVYNILTRLKGKESGKAILLVGHYDSVPSSPGANDDGAAIATIIETLRIIRNGSTLKNDVIALFTDGEEPGLLGAKAFVDQHPWAKDVGLVLNFEARGTHGPVWLFETNGNNGWLVQEFAKAVSHPYANSITYDIYKLLPNSTDFSIFKNAKLTGLNFAYINGLTHYHTKLDNVENVDQASLQHLGSYALSLTRHFGNLELINTINNNDTIYFDILGFTLVHYSKRLVVLQVVGLSVLFIFVLMLGLKKGHLTISGVTLGLLLQLLAMVSVGLLITSLWWIIRRVHSGYDWLPSGNTYNSNLYFISFTSLSLTIGIILYIWAREKIAPLNFIFGNAFWWLLLLISSSLFMQGGTYLFFWPLLSIIIALAIIFVISGEKHFSALQLFILATSIIPAIILIVPMLYMIIVAFSLKLVGAIMPLWMLLLGSVVPLLVSTGRRDRWILPSQTMIIGIVFIIIAGLTSNFSEEHPKQNNIFYALNSDTGRAFWASGDRKPDEWTSQFLSSHIEPDPLSNFFPFNSRPFIKSEADLLPLPAPSINMIESRVDTGIRTLRLHINSERGAPVLILHLDSHVPVLSTGINNHRVEQINAIDTKNTDRWELQYYGLPKEGIVVTLELKSIDPVKIVAVDRSYELPIVPNRSYRSRPSYMMSSMFAHTDSTMVSKTYSF
jgi:hypothetical protein